MPPGEDAVANAIQIDLHILRPDVNQHNLEAARSRIAHHLQVALTGESGLDGETLRIPDVDLRSVENLAGRSNGHC